MMDKRNTKVKKNNKSFRSDIDDAKDERRKNNRKVVTKEKLESENEKIATLFLLMLA